MSLEEDIDTLVADPERVKNMCGLTNVAVRALDQHSTVPHLTITTLAWALSRLCHKMGVSREYMHELVTLGYDYSCTDSMEDKQNAN